MEGGRKGMLLVKQAQRGDPDAFIELIEKYKKDLCRRGNMWMWMRSRQSWQGNLERSTDTCWYLYAGYVCTEPADGLQLHLEQYDKKVSEADEYEEMNTIREEDILLTSQQMPRTEVVNEENGKRQFAYSKISLSLNLSNGFGLDGYVSEDGDSRFVDPYYVRYLALEYEDGSSYVILDQDNNVDNTDYVCGGMGEEQDVMNLVFNRMVDWGKVEKLVVNDVEISIEE